MKNFYHLSQSVIDCAKNFREVCFSQTVPSVALRAMISGRTAEQYMTYLGRQASDRVVKGRKVAW